jgi:hypothetical protein
MQHCHWREIAAECHIGADENSQACGESQTNGLVMGVANADREAVMPGAVYNRLNADSPIMPTTNRIHSWEERESHPESA